MREGGKEPNVPLAAETRGQLQPWTEQISKFIRRLIPDSAQPTLQYTTHATHRAASLLVPFSLAYLDNHTPSIHTCSIQAWHNASEMEMKKKKTLESMQRRYAQLTTRLSKLGFVLQGTITERTIVRPDPKAPEKQKNYGPYYQWTFKRAGKTVTVNLTASQAKTYQRAIDNHRKMEKTIEQMRTLSLKILEAKTQGVKRRKSQH